MKIIVLNDDQVEFTRRMLSEGFLAIKKDNADKPKDFTMLKCVLHKLKRIDKKRK